MSANETVLGAGIADTAAALRAWRREPGPVLAAWFTAALAIAAALLAATLVVAELSVQRDWGALIGVSAPATLADLGSVLARNLLVLCLHAMICVAGFLARRSLPMQAELRSGADRWVHEHAGGAALAFVAAATAFSLATQAYSIGHAARDTATTLQVSAPALLACLLPHALPELVAVFLPLAAFMVAARTGAWTHLLAATAVTTAIALPIIAAAALVETYVTPETIRALLL